MARALYHRRLMGVLTLLSIPIERRSINSVGKLGVGAEADCEVIQAEMKGDKIE